MLVEEDQGINNIDEEAEIFNFTSERFAEYADLKIDENSDCKIRSFIPGRDEER